MFEAWFLIIRAVIQKDCLLYRQTSSNILRAASLLCGSLSKWHKQRTATSYAFAKLSTHGDVPW